jgi:hypothetical protein
VLSKEYKITTVQVSKIIRGVNWSHIPFDPALPAMVIKPKRKSPIKRKAATS